MAEASGARAAIEAFQLEDRTFPPPQGFKGEALVTDAAIYEEAEGDWQGWWLERAKELEHRFTAGIEGLGHPLVSGVRGRGALLGVVLTAPVAAELETRLREAGFLTNAVAPDVLRLAPSLVVTDAQVDAFVAALPAALDAVIDQ